MDHTQVKCSQYRKSGPNRWKPSELYLQFICKSETLKIKIFPWAEVAHAFDPST